MRLLRPVALLAAGLAVAFLASAAPAQAADVSASLAVAITPGTTQIREANPTSFTISVTNRGPNTAPAANLFFVFLQDPHTFQLNLPSYIRKVTSGPGYANWALGNVAVGQTVRTTVTVIGQQLTGSTPNAVPGALILTATSKVPNPLLIHDRAGDTFSTSRVLSTVGPLSHNPFGHLDYVTAVGNKVRVRGWAADPDNVFIALPIALSNNGVASGGFKHPVARPDVAQARGTGPKSGFDITVTLKPGRHSICALAINYGPGTTDRIGCTTIVTH